MNTKESNVIEFIFAEEEDALTVTKLRQKIWAATYCGIYPNAMIDNFDYEWHAAKDLERIKNPDFLVFLIAKGKQKIGYIILKKDNPLLLQSLYILPEYHRQGIGKRAFAFVRDYCCANAIPTFICHCQPDNKNAMAFYQRMGGRIIERHENEEESWQNSVVFQFGSMSI